MADRSFTVRAVACDHRSDDRAVYEALRRAVEPLERSMGALRSARKIAIKLNQDWPKEKVVTFEGQRRQLVSDSVARAVFRLLREQTTAELVCVDASYMKIYEGTSVEQTTNVAPRLAEFGIRYVDGTEPPFVEREVPGGGRLFRSYTLPAELLEADSVVSVAKMKNHAFMGATGCLKNLFGLMPAEPWARSRHYYHHLIRMPYMLADLGGILNPVLNVVDALVGQAGSEWSRSPDAGRIVGALIAGDNAVATDACMAWLMGHDPASDWGTDPFLRDRNPLLVAAETGLGTVDLDTIDWRTEVQRQPAGTFFCERIDGAATIASWRRSMCEQALFYRDHRGEIASRHRGEYILLQRGQVRWASRDARLRASRRELAGTFTDQSLFLKYVDPDEREQERYEIYERALEKMAEVPR